MIKTVNDVFRSSDRYPQRQEGQHENLLQAHGFLQVQSKLLINYHFVKDPIDHWRFRSTQLVSTFSTTGQGRLDSSMVQTYFESLVSLGLLIPVRPTYHGTHFRIIRKVILEKVEISVFDISSTTVQKWWRKIGNVVLLSLKNLTICKFL